MTLRRFLLTTLMLVSPAYAQDSKLQSVICCTRSGCGKLSDHPYRLTPTAAIEIRLETGRWCRVRIAPIETIRVVDRQAYGECERVYCQGP
jgi:hypothetical protein